MTQPKKSKQVEPSIFFGFRVHGFIQIGIGIAIGIGFQGFWFQGFRVSRFQGFIQIGIGIAIAIGFQGFWFQGFRVSGFTVSSKSGSGSLSGSGFRVSGFRISSKSGSGSLSGSGFRVSGFLVSGFHVFHGFIQIGVAIGIDCFESKCPQSVKYWTPREAGFRAVRRAQSGDGQQHLSASYASSGCSALAHRPIVNTA